MTTAERSTLIDPTTYKLDSAEMGHYVFLTVSGSHLYGFPSADSDVDLRGAHTAYTEDVLGLDAKRYLEETREEMRQESNADIVTHEIHKFMLLACKNSGMCLEQLFSPYVVIDSPAFYELRELVPKLVTRKHGTHYLGFANAQIAMMRRRPDKEVKILLYIFRTLMTGIHFVRTGKVEANILVLNEGFKLPFVDDLVREKVEGKEKSGLSGGHALDYYIERFSIMLAMLEDALAVSTLPDRPDEIAKKQLNNLLLRVRSFNHAPHC